ncbi:MAG TPA: alpha/beta hydrolase [Pyrinomonadaceae bacterium]
MHKVVLLLLLSIVIATSVTIHGQQRQDPPWLKEFVNKRIVYQVPGMKNVQVKRNLIYKRAGDRGLEMDVYSPRASRGRLAAVLFIHGGRIPPNLLTTPKDWAVYVSLGELMAASAFVGVTFNHRFHTWESLADSQSDVMDAVKYVRDNAATLGIDSERIVLWGISAGGIFLSQPLRDRPAFISCLIAYYAQLDLRDSRRSAPTSVTDQTLRDFSPVYYLEKDGKGIPPVLLARAGLDSAELNAGMDRFAQLGLSKNLTLDLLNHPTGHHGFDIEDDNDRSREILKRTIEFIRNHSQGTK